MRILRRSEFQSIRDIGASDCQKVHFSLSGSLIFWFSDSPSPTEYSGNSFYSLFKERIRQLADERRRPRDEHGCGNGWISNLPQPKRIWRGSRSSRRARRSFTFFF